MRLLLLILALRTGEVPEPADDKARALFEEGRRQSLAGRQEAALRAFSQALKIRPDPQTYDARGVVLEAEKRYAAAAADFTAALRQRPDFADAYAHRGTALDELGRYGAAVSDYSRALALSGPSATLYFNRGAAYEHARMFGKALADYAEAARLDPSLEPARAGLKRLGS